MSVSKESVFLADIIQDSFIDTMLCCQSNLDNPVVRSPGINILAIKSLLRIPLERFSKKNRERIMKSWLPDSDNGQKNESTYQFSLLDHGLLSLKIKVMKRPTFYEVSIPSPRYPSHVY